MTVIFRDAVLDILLPAEAAPPSGRPALPSGNAVGIDLASQSETAKPVLELIAAAAGGEEAFMAASPEARRAAVAAVEVRSPDAFRRLIALILAGYCETADVLAALGGATEPPQPYGQPLAEMDGAAASALDKVRRRTKLWRG
jgi:hypothetical protein